MIDGLEKMDTKDLLAEFNRLSEKKLTGWKGKKLDLATRVAKLRAAARPRTRPIKAAAYELICAVAYIEPGTNRKIGYDYDEILRRIHAEFPGCSTTDKCLRWYAVQLQADAILPYRPRRSPKRSKAPPP